MTTPLIFVIAAILVLGAVIYLLSSVTRYRGSDLDEIASQLRPIDIAAFRNLIDEREEEFLRSSLPAFTFWRVHRERMLAAVDYVRGAARNAATLIRLADAAKYDPDPAVATAAESLLENAIQVRLYALQTIPRFYLSILIPGVRHAPCTLVERYSTMTSRRVTMRSLQSAGATARVVCVDGGCKMLLMYDGPFILPKPPARRPYTASGGLNFRKEPLFTHRSEWRLPFLAGHRSASVYH